MWTQQMRFYYTKKESKVRNFKMLRWLNNLLGKQSEVIGLFFDIQLHFIRCIHFLPFSFLHLWLLTLSQYHLDQSLNRDRTFSFCPQQNNVKWPPLNKNNLFQEKQGDHSLQTSVRTGNGVFLSTVKLFMFLYYFLLLILQHRSCHESLLSLSWKAHSFVSRALCVFVLFFLVKCRCRHYSCRNTLRPVSFRVPNTKLILMVGCS